MRKERREGKARRGGGGGGMDMRGRDGRKQRQGGKREEEGGESGRGKNEGEREEGRNRALQNKSWAALELKSVNKFLTLQL